MDIDTVLHHYLIAALWADMPEDDSAGTIADIHPDSVADARREVAAFIELSGPLVDRYQACMFDGAIAPEQFGHDIWLTRQGHGAGFWDRMNLPSNLGDKLTAIAESIGERNIYRGDDGRIYLD